MSLLKRLLVLAGVGCLALVMSLGLGGKTNAATVACGSGATCPVFKVTGGDVFAGGWFSSGCSANYQNYQYGSPPNTGNGGILTYATEDGSGNATGGSSSQYGAFALGSIEGSDSANYGFNSGTAIGGSKNRLSFANLGFASGSPWGGQFDGANSQLHCIPDYWGKMPSATTSLPEATCGTSSGTVSYKGTPSAGTNFNLITCDSTISAGSNVTVYIDGSVYIHNNITYAPHNATNVPKFVLVARGNIYIDPNVTELDGWYIAQPAAASTPSTNDGTIWSCHPNNQSTTLQWTDVDGCTNTLTVNGALVAKQVNLTRINSSGIGTGSPNTPAEIINYVPDMVLGGPFFDATGNSAIDSLVSLPPVF